MRQKIFRQNRGTPKKFLYQKQIVSETQRCPLRKFWYCEKKFFKRKSWYTPLILKTFRYPKLMNWWRFLPRKVSVVWNKKLSTKSWYSYYPQKLWYQNVSETRKGSPTNVFSTVRQNIFNREFRSTHIMHKNFSINEIGETLKGSPAKSLPTVRHRIIDRKSWYSFHPKNFW